MGVRACVCVGGGHRHVLHLPCAHAALGAFVFQKVSLGADHDEGCVRAMVLALRDPPEEMNNYACSHGTVSAMLEQC